MFFVRRHLKPLLGQSPIKTSRRALRASGRQTPKHEIEVATNAPETIAPEGLPVPSNKAESHLTESDIDWSREMDVIRIQELRSVLEPIEHFDSSTSYPMTRPAHNLAAFVKNSETLQKFINLGVDLHQIERRNGLAQFVIKLDFEQDVKPHMQFLTDLGLPADALGTFITKNPLIFKEHLDDLSTRVHYLQSKLFNADGILRIVQANPFWLMFSTQRIDGRLGFFQKNFELTGQEVRQLTVRQPRLITYGLESVRKSSFVIREEFGFDKDETKSLLLAAPKLWMMNADTLTTRFEYAHKTMQLSHQRIASCPEILYCREHRLRHRHEYLMRLGKAQYDPSRPLYVSFKHLVEGTDHEFVLNVAKTSYADFDRFLRTL